MYNRPMSQTFGTSCPGQPAEDPANRLLPDTGVGRCRGAQRHQADALARINRDIVACRRCPRLVAYTAEVARTKRRAYRDWDYWGRPVPSFGDPLARLLIVGLAPAAHGANRTGRMFTGDASGDWLYRALYRAGFANQPTSTHRGDGLELRDAYITATCHCAPPDNKPSRDEMVACRDFLRRELEALRTVRVIVCLGQIAFDAVLRLMRERGYGWPVEVSEAQGVSAPPGPDPNPGCSFHHAPKAGGTAGAVATGGDGEAGDDRDDEAATKGGGAAEATAGPGGSQDTRSAGSSRTNRPRTAKPRFRHGGEYRWDAAEPPAPRSPRPDLPSPPVLLASYHPSRQNTQTGVLTEAMFDAVFRRARELLDRESTRGAPSGLRRSSGRGRA
ncbi:uracil-DNA glycosylase [Thermaerobacter composti]|uniref:Type-5 uracil-DNA glycosylase n=1 Tax=Thermaerobacter composti TaxID=554949 RepID=A0ABZ0QSY8_9FIRM|nr:uracil-DNA glycosylase [Thermaerobacter composti]WPD19565.1 uracil-DNA glycosylase [Thermaerobacter composti]